MTTRKCNFKGPTYAGLLFLSPVMLMLAMMDWGPIASRAPASRPVWLWKGGGAALRGSRLPGLPFAGRRAPSRARDGRGPCLGRVRQRGPVAAGARIRGQRLPWPGSSPQSDPASRGRGREQAWDRAELLWGGCCGSPSVQLLPGHLQSSPVRLLLRTSVCFRSALCGELRRFQLCRLPPKSWL